ncbi:MAG: winged helix-turn-helix domain-containing protein [Candidatus Kapaibacterium sp.]
MKNILIIEDEPKVARFIQRGLNAEGFRSDIALLANEGLRMAAEQDYDVITVDLMLPGMDGYSIIEELRARNAGSAVLILSARDTLEDKLRGFKVGSDDYLTKPFEFEELVARINALARRMEVAQPVSNSLEYDELCLDSQIRSVQRGSRKIELTKMEFRLLEYLVRNAETVCSRSKIAANVWHEHFDRETNIVDVYMMYLRKKIDAPGDTPLIHTVRGAGYMLHRENRGKKTSLS